MRQHIFILVPSPHPTGPVKGAYALANALASERQVTVVTLKPGPGVDAPLNPKVGQYSLAGVAGGWRERLRAYRVMLQECGGRAETASISMCLSADIVNRYCRAEAITLASVRGNLLHNYRYDYGLPGVVFAIGHLMALGEFDHVVAMTTAMAEQVRFFTRKLPKVIGNFVDEAALDQYRINDALDGPPRFVFVGSLSERKQPALVVSALSELHRCGCMAELDIIGKGPLHKSIEVEVAKHDLQKSVRLHGHLADPHLLIARADALVLPSVSEGISRAALEALYLGIPCVLRAVDGNAELIGQENSGTLFNHDDELAGSMAVAAKQRRQLGRSSCLLPPAFRQHAAARRYLQLIDESQ